MLVEKYIYSNDFILLIPELFLGISIVILLLVGIIYEEYAIRVGKKMISVLVNQSLLLIGLLGLLYYNSIDLEGYSGLFILFKNQFNIYGLIFLCVVKLIYLVYLRSYLKSDKLFSYEYILLLLLSFLGISLVMVTNSFLMLYLVIELQTLCFYILVSFRQSSDYNLEAGLKYFVLGSLVSGFLLFGISLFYGYTGITNFSDIWYYNLNTSGVETTKNIVVVAILLIFSSLLFKVGSVPFHMWLIDVYGGSSYSFLTYVAIIPKISLFVLLLKFYFVYFNEVLIDLNYILIYCSMFSIFIGTVGALLQTSVKRLLAYSAISHVGYILLGFVSSTIEGLYGVVLYLIVYVIIMLVIFGIFMNTRSSELNESLLNLSSINGLYAANKLHGIILIIGLFSVSGIPPLIGFFSKLYIYFSLLVEGYYIFLVLSILMSVVGVVYYIRLIRVLFFTENLKFMLLKPQDTYVSYMLSVLTVISIYFILYSKYLLLFLNNLILDLNVI